MNKFYFLFLFLIIVNIIISPIFFEQIIAQENQNISPRQNWKQNLDPNLLTCNDGLILLQKNNGDPACISPSTYIKLVDRGYGKFDLSELIKRPGMLNLLFGGMVNDQQLIKNWHSLILNNSKAMQQTTSNFIVHLKGNPDSMEKIMGSITTNPLLRDQMIATMKEHNLMMISLLENPRWMESVHQPLVGSNMSQERHVQEECSWCHESDQKNLDSNPEFHHPKTMDDMVHQLWITENTREQMNNFMVENQFQAGFISEQVMETVLRLMMDDPELRQKMIEMMLENQEFMDTIRHEN